MIKSDSMTLLEYYNLAYEKQKFFFRKYYIQKLGYYPTKIEKIVRKLTKEEAYEEDKLETIDFEIFLRKCNK